MTSFESGEQLWIERLGSLRNVVRQEVVARQIAPLAVRGASVLDVGCGQGTQALRLASSGCQVTAVEPSSELLARCGDAALAQSLELELLQGRIGDLGELCGDRTFDLVCCHGVMMYLDDWAQAIADIGERVRTGGRASITFRNGDALAMRPGLRGDWAAALAALESTDYTNELGLPAHACTAAEIDVALGSAGLRPDAWYGVRVFTDRETADAPPPDPETLALLLDAEERAGATDPYKWVASQLHVVAARLA